MNEELSGIELPKWEMLPDIGLYMDQVITLMERTLSPVLPAAEITKSMVNNYVKVGLIPRPVGKKYDREHLAMLLMIGMLKQALSMECIAQVTGYLCEQGVESGYKRFSGAVKALSDGIWSGDLSPGLPDGGPDSPRRQAVYASVTAAVWTIHARRQLAALRDPAKKN